MKLRFNIREAVYDSSNNTLCNPNQEIDYNNISGQVTINGVGILTILDLGAGTILTPSFPVTANNVTVNGYSIENTKYLVLDVDVPNIWDYFDLNINLVKSDYVSLNRDFIIYGYDTGQNPNIPVTANNPNFDLILIPATYPSVAASVQVPLAVGETWEIVADNLGTVGNGITLTGDGISIVQDLVTVWNTANPANTISATNIGNNNTTTAVPNGQVITLTGGGNDVIPTRAFADFVAWRRPFTNDVYTFANYSNIQDSARYTDDTGEIGNTHTLFLSCYKGVDTTFISEVYEYDGCGVATLVDTCVSDSMTVENLNLVPEFNTGVSCINCCQEDCIVIVNDNYVQFIIKVDNISTLNVDDVAVISTENVDIAYSLYDNCGGLITSETKNVSLNPLPALSDLQLPITLPDEGDFVLITTVNGVAFECKKSQIITGCNQYKLTKVDCKTRILKNLSLTDITYVVEKFNSDLTWTEVISTVTVPRCQESTILTDEDGVYRILISDGTSVVYVQDCKMQECFLAFTKQLICNAKPDCACGGNCDSSCQKIPVNLYDFSTFSLLVYNYHSLINRLYIENFIFTTFEPNDLADLFNIDKILTRIKEYCGNCNESAATINNSNCGCSK